MSNEIFKFGTEAIKLSGVQDLINALVEHYFGNFIMLNKISKLAHDTQVSIIEDMLSGKITSIPEENLYNPVNSEQEPLLFNSFDLLKNSMSSEHYRELFATLIASTFDKSKYPDLHPSFPFIIQQLTPLDAKIITDINRNNEAYTFGMHYSFSKDENTESDDFLDFYLILNEENVYEDVELTNIAINNLVKQGLIQLENIDNNENLKVQNFDNTKFKKLVEKYMNRDDGYRGGGTTGPSSKIIITRLGKSFLDVCLDT